VSGGGARIQHSAGIQRYESEGGVRGEGSLIFFGSKASLGEAINQTKKTNSTQMDAGSVSSKGGGRSCLVIDSLSKREQGERVLQHSEALKNFTGKKMRRPQNKSPSN